MEKVKSEETPQGALRAPEDLEKALTKKLEDLEVAFQDARQGISELKDLVVEKDFDLRNLRRQYMQLEHAYKALKAATKQ